MVILPSSPSLDDLEPCVKLAHDLKSEGISPTKIAFAFTVSGQSISSDNFALSYLSQACNSGYFLLEGSMPFKASIRQALNLGHTPNEVQYKSVRRKVNEFTQSIVDRFQFLINQNG